ncbi:MAG: ATPase, T2SS/T4P/T4SS family [bacterium]|nr:ATPase, T2SS/T4P/T4SS family [bacterium]
MLSIENLKEIIKKFKITIPAATMRAANAKATKTGISLEDVLIAEGAIDETTLYEKAADFFDVPFVALKGREIKKEILSLIPGPVAGTHQIIAFDKEKNELKVAMTDPTDIQTVEFLRRKTGLDPKIYLTTPSDIKDAMRRYHADLEANLLIGGFSADGKEVSVKDLKREAEEVPIINIVNSVLEHAVFEGASDIHIEPEEKELAIRYRIDGILKPVMNLPKTIQNGVMARIKILANLKIDEHMIPQDGRFKAQIQDEKLAFRVSIIPVYDGEKVVMRLLHEGSKPLPLDQLGFLDKPRQIIEAAVKKPHGMILVTGPTGSGKTTTLYTLLGMLNTPGVNISTIEDPIEYRMQGVNQSQINPKVGFTFATGLRAFLRQDPNIIMVGEIRDQETAEIAIHAAMTGHLVLSTLHTNDAPTTLPRLIDMGVPPFMVAFTVNIIVAQRLIRKICPYCKKEYRLDKAAFTELAKVFDTTQLLKLLKNNNVKLKTEEKKLENIIFYKGAGCRRCGQTGFKGRMGIYEIMEITPGLTKLINEHADANDIKTYAREHGMLTMTEDGLIKCKMGITTIAEIVRVTKE